MSSPVVYVDTPRVEHVGQGHALHHSNNALYYSNSGSPTFEPTVLVATPLPFRSAAAIDHTATFQEAEVELKKVQTDLSFARRNRARWALFFMILNWFTKVVLGVIAFITAFLPYIYKEIPDVAVTCLRVATFVASLPMFAALAEHSMRRYQNAKDLDQIAELCSNVQMLLINVMKDSIITNEEAYDLDAAIARLLMAAQQLSFLGTLIDLTAGAKLDVAKQAVSTLRLVTQATSTSSIRTVNVYKRQQSIRHSTLRV